MQATSHVNSTECWSMRGAVLVSGVAMRVLVVSQYSTELDVAILVSQWIVTLVGVMDSIEGVRNSAEQVLFCVSQPVPPLYLSSQLVTAGSNLVLVRQLLAEERFFIFFIPVTFGRELI